MAPRFEDIYDVDDELAAMEMGKKALWHDMEFLLTVRCREALEAALSEFGSVLVDYNGETVTLSRLLWLKTLEKLSYEEKIRLTQVSRTSPGLQLPGCPNAACERKGHNNMMDCMRKCVCDLDRWVAVP